MLKKMAVVLMLALWCMVSACALAQSYTLGDTVEDFTATLSCGSDEGLCGGGLQRAAAAGGIPEDQGGG